MKKIILTAILLAGGSLATTLDDVPYDTTMWSALDPFGFATLRTTAPSNWVNSVISAHGTNTTVHANKVDVSAFALTNAATWLAITDLAVRKTAWNEAYDFITTGTAGIANNSNRINTSFAYIANNSNRVTTANANIANVSNAVVTANSNIAANSNRLVTAFVYIAANSNGLVTANAKIANTSNTVVTLDARLTATSNALSSASISPSAVTGIVTSAISPYTNGATLGATALQSESDTNAIARINALTNSIATAWQNPASATNWTWTSDGREITLTGYNFASLDVVIPDILDGLPVTKMENIFSVPPSYAGSEITSISGGEKISTIKYASFSGCLSLTNIALYGVQYLEAFSFAGCEALKTVFVKKVLSVGDYSFDTCTALTIFKISTDAPEEKTLVFWHIPTNQVTITVDNPTAAGWGATWNGMPVIRLPVKAQEVNAGTVISITSTTDGTNSAGFFSGNGAGLTNLPISASYPMSYTPIRTTAGGTTFTANVTTARSIYEFTASSANVLTNNLSAIPLNCTTNYQWTVGINYTVTNALSTTWDSRIEWVGLASTTPDLTVTGRYEFAFSTSCGTKIIGRQVYPTVYQWEPAFTHAAGANLAGNANRYVNLISSGVYTNYVVLSGASTTKHALYKFAYIVTTATNLIATVACAPQITTTGFEGGTQTNTLSVSADWSAPKYTSIVVAPASTASGYVHILRAVCTPGTSSVNFNSGFWRYLNELEVLTNYRP